MKRTLGTTLILFILTAVFIFPVAAETIQCAECGMMVDTNSKFSAKILQGDTPLWFCDIGDLFSYLKRTGAKDARAEVKDYATGEWIDARKAYYVRDGKKFKTPMGWGVAAFVEKNEALKSGAAIDFDGAAKALK
jgi:nitrous oxide reductase accessory protein NosL